MKAKRFILHIDMDAYFASLESQACPFLRGKPLVVGAMPGSRGVVASASYEARKFGIRAGMPVTQARRICPGLEHVPCHPSLYIHTSSRIMKLLLEVTSLVEMFSIDEAFLDITDLIDADAGEPAGWRRAEQLAREISGWIESRFNLTCSIGIGPNRLLAKMASKMEKPRGVTALNQQAFRSHFSHRPVDDLYGVGEKTAASLMIFGIERIGELAETPVEFLRGRFGTYGDALHAMAHGEDESHVVALHESPLAKSMGHEHTLQRDTVTLDEGLALLLSLTERVSSDMRGEGLAGKRVAIKMRYADFSTLTRQRMLSFPTQETRDVYRTAKALFLGNYCGDGIRLLGVTVGELMETGGRQQIGLFPEDRRYRQYLDALDQVRNQFGPESLRVAGGLAVRSAERTIAGLS